MSKFQGLGLQGWCLLSVMLLFAFMTYPGANQFEEPVVFYYNGTPVIYATCVLLINFLINIIQNINKAIIGDSIFLFARCVTCLVPILYSSDVNSFISHYYVAWVALFAFVMGICADVKKMKQYSWLYVVFALILCIQVMLTFKRIDVDYMDLSYKSYMTIPIAASNVIATYLSPVLWIVVFNLDIKKSAKIIFVIILLISLILTKSRGGIVGLTMTFILYYILTNHNHKIRTFIFFVFTCITCFLLFRIPEVAIFFEGYSEAAISNGVDGLTSGRLSLFKEGLSTFTNNPLLGSGYMVNATKNVTGAHNFIIELLIESGIIGTLLFMIPIIRTYKRCIRNLNREYVFGFFMFSVGTLFHGLFEVNFFSYSTDIIFWFSLGVLNRINYNYENLTSK